MGLLRLVFPTAQSKQLQGGMDRRGPQLLLAVLMAGPSPPPLSLSQGWEKGRGGGLRHGTPLPGGCAFVALALEAQLAPPPPQAHQGRWRGFRGNCDQGTTQGDQQGECHLFAQVPPSVLFLTCVLLCGFFSSKPPEETAWPSRCEWGYRPEGPAGQGLWIVLAQQGGPPEAWWGPFAFSPGDQPLAQPPLRCRVEGGATVLVRPPHFLKERNFPGIKRSLTGDTLCSVAFCAKGEGRATGLLGTNGLQCPGGHVQAALAAIALLPSDQPAWMTRTPTPAKHKPRDVALKPESLRLRGRCCPCPV